MIKSVQKQIAEEFYSEALQIMVKKGDDYANQDRLSNFKKVGVMTNECPEMVCINLIATKVARLVELLKYNKEANNESIKDSLLDLANYSNLCYQLTLEK